MPFRSTALIAAVTLSVVLSLGGCKSNNNQPAATSSQPASTSGQPAASSGQPAAASGGVVAPGQQAAAPAPPPPPAVVDLPGGTELPVHLDADLGSAISHPGDTFTATIADDVLAHGKVVIPRGARAEGTVVDAKPLGHFKGGALLSVRLDRVHTRWGG
ncbi:MAG: hypothetical protein WCC26_16065, partial [Terracidiphilus sp.]